MVQAVVLVFVQTAAVRARQQLAPYLPYLCHGIVETFSQPLSEEKLLVKVGEEALSKGVEFNRVGSHSNNRNLTFVLKLALGGVEGPKPLPYQNHTVY